MRIEQSPSHDQLVRGLTHKMNNILTLFHGYVGLLLDNKSLDTTTRANLSKIKEGACAASELMDRTHALVRSTAVVARPLDLPFFFSLIRPCALAMCGPQTVFEVVVAEELPSVRTDAGRLKVAVLELIRNACESLGDHQGLLRLSACVEHSSTESTGEARSWMVLRVSDNGPGVPPEAADRIFQPFFSTKHRKNAAGLGLNVAVEAIQHLGGTLRHERDRLETRFEIRLPLDPARTASETPVQDSHPACSMVG